MKNNKAFTLVELIVTIVIITLILLFALPSVYKIIKDNDKTEYEYYYKVAKEASYVYADTKKDNLGGSLGNGCINGISIQDLINLGFLKPFNKEDIDYSGNVVIRNNYGKLTVSLYMEIDGNKYGAQDTDTCVAYTPNDDTTLSDKLLALNENKQYIVGEVSNNYVWYSGKLWRAVQIDNNSKETLLITDDIISVIPFDNDTNGFKDSYVESWLNDYFLNSLYSPKTYISNHTWETGVNKKVGLITKSDFDASKDSDNKTYLDIGNYGYWLFDKNTTEVTKQKRILEGNIEDSTITTATGIRPAIYFHAGIKVVGGSGTKTDPYQLEGNKIQDISDKKLNTRHSGEYVKIDDNLYRIVNIIDNKTKLVSVDALTIEDASNKKMTNQNYTLSNIYTYLNTTWYETLNIKDKVTLGDWCLAPELEALDLTQCTNNRSFKIGLPKYGEIFTSDIAKTNNAFWTLTPGDTEQMVTILRSFTTYTTIDSTLGVKPSFYLNSDTTITSGSGTETDPFVL